MGGMHGFGRIPIDEDDRPFHHPWEARVFASNLALAVHTANIDRFRYRIETIPPAEYLSASYYERWLASVLALAEEQGFLTPGQLQSIRAGQVPMTTPADTEAAPPELADLMVNAPAGGKRDLSGESRFAVGDPVRAVQRHTAGHTRLPRYVRGRAGTVVRDNGNQLFADIHADTGERVKQRVYTVRFNATELWGPDANPGDTVNVDLWESYLDAP